MYLIISFTISLFFLLLCISLVYLPLTSYLNRKPTHIACFFFPISRRLSLTIVIYDVTLVWQHSLYIHNLWV